MRIIVKLRQIRELPAGLAFAFLFDSKIFWFASFLGLSFASSNDQGVVL
jgi:hypothetical protein